MKVIAGVCFGLGKISGIMADTVLKCNGEGIALVAASLKNSKISKKTVLFNIPQFKLIAGKAVELIFYCCTNSISAVFKFMRSFTA